MPAERAGYTVTMFVVELSPSMGDARTVEVQDSKGGDSVQVELTHLEWSLQFVKLKIQEMIFNGRKTDQCGVIVFGTPETKNVLNDRGKGYEHVFEYIPIGQPNASTLTKLDALRPTSVCGDPIDAIIVAVETQQIYMAKKATWTRRMVLLTDGQSPIELDEWESTTRAINERNIIFTIVGVDFDDEELPFEEENKSEIKKVNEEFYHTFISKLDSGVLGTCAFALQEIARPELKTVKSVLMGTTLRIGDVDVRPEEAMEIMVKSAKCTALTRPKGWKRFMKREKEKDVNKIDVVDVDQTISSDEETVYAQLKMRSEYLLEQKEEEEASHEEERTKKEPQEKRKIEEEELVRGFKYGSTYVPCPDGQFERLKTRKGIDICGFFKRKNFRRELAMGEVQYIWADPGSPNQQVALSSIVQGMTSAKVMAIARWVTKDGMDPKMGVLVPRSFDKVDCLLWIQMPFADDVRKYTFASLGNLITKQGELVTKHAYLPTEEQQKAMDDLVDVMDLMDAGEKDEAGDRLPWYDNRLSYNPAVHRIKQAMFHSAVVTDVSTQPLPPPHHEILKYFDPPKRVLKHANGAAEECRKVFKVKKVPKKVVHIRKDGHVHAQDEDDDMLLLDKVPARRPQTQHPSPVSQPPLKKPISDEGDDSGSGTEEDEQPDFEKRPPLPTPSRSLSLIRPPDTDMEVDQEREPGRIVGSAFPLRDFQKNIAAEGDVVSKTVEDLAFVIREVVKKPFASRRYEEMIVCMKSLREVCLKEDEIDAWNEFMMDLREECTEEEPGNVEFWGEVKKEGRPMSLISKPEAAKQGGKSRISESFAEEFLQK